MTASLADMAGFGVREDTSGVSGVAPASRRISTMGSFPWRDAKSIADTPKEVLESTLAPRLIKVRIKSAGSGVGDKGAACNKSGPDFAP